MDARYDGGPFVPVRPLTGGYANDVFLVEGALGPAVLRVKYPPSDEASIRWEHELVGRLASSVPEVIAPLHAREGSTFFFCGDDAVWLTPYVGGEHAHTEHARAVASLLARLHVVTTSLTLPPRPGPEGLEQLRSLDATALPHEWRERAERMRAQALDLLNRLASRRLATGIVHGDIYRGNILVRGGEVVGIFDWEEAHRAPFASELANFVWEFSKDEARDDFDRDLGARLIEDYRHGGGPVADDELELIVPLIRAKRVLEVLRAPTDRQVDWVYQEHNLRTAESLR